MIIGIEGKPGAGKSTFATWQALRWANRQSKFGRRENRQILANFAMDVPGARLATWDEMYKASNAICIIDEAGSLFNAREFRENTSKLGYFTQHRKEALTLFVIAQSMNMLDVVIREYTMSSVWHVKRLFGPNEWEEPTRLEEFCGWWALARKFDGTDYGKVTKQVCLQKQFFRLDEFHGRFDTLAKISKRDEHTSGAGLAAAGVQDAPDYVLTAQDLMTGRTADPLFNRVAYEQTVDSSVELFRQTHEAAPTAGAPFVSVPELPKNGWRKKAG